METTEKRPQQADLTRQARRLDRKTLSPLGKLTLVALLGTALMNTLAFVSILLIEGIVIPPLPVIVVVTGLAAGAVAAGFRPAPLLGAIVILISSVPMLADPITIYRLTHPEQPFWFILIVLTLAFSLVAIVAGVGTTVQNYRGARR
jgi:hypothetical protein